MKGNPPEEEWHRESPLYWEFYQGGSALALRFGKWKALRKPMFTGKGKISDAEVARLMDLIEQERRSGN